MEAISSGVKLYQGDITKLKVDAIVNAANNRLIMGGGVAGAIKRSGGKVIEDEARRKGPISIGEAVATGAGALFCQYVIHAAVMGMDFATDERKICQATRSALKKALDLGIKSIAFPALGTGVGGFPLKRCAQLMLKEVWEHLKGPTSLKEVTFALYDHKAYKVFGEVLDKQSIK